MYSTYGDLIGARRRKKLVVLQGRDPPTMVRCSAHYKSVGAARLVNMPLHSVLMKGKPQMSSRPEALPSCALAVPVAVKIRPRRLSVYPTVRDLYLVTVSQSCCISLFLVPTHSCYMLLLCSLGRRGTCRSSSHVPGAMHPEMS